MGVFAVTRIPMAHIPLLVLLVLDAKIFRKPELQTLINGDRMRSITSCISPDILEAENLQPL